MGAQFDDVGMPKEFENLDLAFDLLRILVHHFGSVDDLDSDLPSELEHMHRACVDGRQGREW